MGLNSYLAEAAGFGYVTATTVAMVHNIEPKSGKRIVIVGFGASAGSANEIVYFMNPTRTTVSAALASGITTVVLTADPLDPSGNIIAASDNICIELDDGTYLFTTISAWQTSNLTATLATATSSSCAALNGFWNFGVAADNGHFAYAVALDTTASPEVDSGLFYAPNKGYPMKAYLLSATDIACSINYVTVGYIKQ